MPYYRFSLNVPAEASVVAERLRSLVGHRYDSWIDREVKPAFFGKIKDNSFRIRRNIGPYRNSFLPRILGRITRSGVATRVSVAMWMNPLVLGFMLFWFAGVGFGARASLEANPQRFPITALLLTFWLCLMLGSFYWEARKARTLLSNAVMNLSIESPDAMGVCPADGETLGLKKSYRGFIGIALALLVLIHTGLTLYQWRKSLRDCPAFQESLAIITQSPEARRALGDHIQIAGFARGFVQNGKEFGYAMISIPVRGSHATGTVHTVANRVQGRWDLERVALWTNREKQRIDLTPATFRESFRYPAQGAAYLLPFDRQSAEQLKELPAYYAVRLGLRAIVLPVMPLGPEVIDRESHQILAERAVDLMERNTRNLNGEVDAVFVGVTSQDLNIKSSGWRYATNYRMMDRFAIVSTARLHNMPVLAGANPEVFPIRVRKMVTKNLAMLVYPLGLSADPTSALANSVFTANDVDKMSQEFLGELGKWAPVAVSAPCYSIIRGPDGRQVWKAECSPYAPNDNRWGIRGKVNAIPG